MARHDDKDKFDQSYDDNHDYQFKEDEGPVTYDYDDQGEGGDVSSKKSFKSSLREKLNFSPREMLGNKRTRSLLLVIVVVIVLFILYEIFTSVSGKKPAANIPQPFGPTTTPTQQTLSPAAMPAPPVSLDSSTTTATDQADVPAPMPQTTATEETDSDSPLASTNLHADVAAIKKNQDEGMEKLQSQQEEAQTQLLNLKSQLASLTDQVTTVNQSLQSVTENLQFVRQQIHQQVTEKQKAIRQTKRYFVDAIIPGRAWLKASDGSTVTVIVGDSLPGYGQITQIDAISGAVMTSKGEIPYGIEGS